MYFQVFVRPQSLSLGRGSKGTSRQRWWEGAVSLESTGELRRVYCCYKPGRYENDAGEVAGCRQHSPQRHFLGGFGRDRYEGGLALGLGSGILMLTLEQQLIKGRTKGGRE